MASEEKMKALDAALAQIEKAVWKGFCDEARRFRLQIWEYRCTFRPAL